MPAKKYGVASDRIKASLAVPKMGMAPTGTAKANPKGKNFKPKGMAGKK